MKIMGLDLGFRQVKVSTVSKDFTFDSVIGYPSAIELKEEGSHEAKALSNLSLEYGGTIYYVGEKAIRDTKNSQLTFTADKTDNQTDLLKTLTALGEATDEETAEYRIVSGLPVDELGIDGLKEKMISNLTGQYVFKLNNKDRNITVAKVTIIAQSAGAYYDYILDKTGKLIEDRVQPKIIVIDIGFRTTDIVCMENGRYNPSESFTIYTGVHNIHSELRKLLLKKHRVQKHPTEIDKIMKDGFITLNGAQVDLTEEIAAAKKPYAEKILSELPLYIENLSEVNQFLIAGGGGDAMSDIFLGAFSSPTELLDHAEEANARGYYKYSLLLTANGR